MLLLQLAPVIQEELLFLPMVVKCGEPILERELREIAAEVSWNAQVVKWRSFNTGETKEVH
jgi:hypothetical protein